MIRDRIVVGLQDVKFSERLQTDPDLTLQKAIQLGRQSEAVKKQQALIQVITKPRWQNGMNGKRTPPKSTEKQEICQKCGKSPSHSKQRCPAQDVICRKCKKKGHYEVVCRSSKVIGSVQEDDLF